MKKLIILLCVLLAGASVLAGCAKQQTNADGSAPSSNTAQPQANKANDNGAPNLEDEFENAQASQNHSKAEKPAEKQDEAEESTKKQETSQPTTQYEGGGIVLPEDIL